MQVNYLVMQFKWGKRQKYNTTKNLMWVYLGKGKCMYFTFMQKKSIQIKKMYIPVLA